MALTETYEVLAREDLLGYARAAKADGARFVQMCATADAEGIDLLYTFRRGSRIENRRISLPDISLPVPSITDYYLEAFVFENEAHDLFGANIEGIAIDFAGAFYNLAEPRPMAPRKEDDDE